jgi:ketosteroid isomerase-like protein
MTRSERASPGSAAGMHSSDAKHVALSLFACFSEGRVDAALALLDDDVSWRIPASRARRRSWACATRSRSLASSAP